jgi:hypothetical protein
MAATMPKWEEALVLAHHRISRAHRVPDPGSGSGAGEREQRHRALH